MEGQDRRLLRHLPNSLRLPRLPRGSRRQRDRWAARLFLTATILPLALVLLMLGALLARTWPILRTQPLWQLLTGHTWRPLRGQFGFYPFIAGTVWVTVVAVVMAVPPCLLSAFYLVEYAQPFVRSVAKPLLDLLAGIPSVVYGVWGVVAVVPWVQEVLAPTLGRWLGFLPLFAPNNPSGFSVLAGGVVLAAMIAPFIVAVTYEVLISVPNDLREASLAVGATRWQTVKHAIAPCVLPGLVAGIALGASRALGETMAVLMVVGNVAQVPSSIFDPAYPLPALIANNYGEMLSIPLYDAALLGAALMLLLMVILFNAAATLVLRHFTGRE